MAGGGGVVVARLSSDCPVCAYVVPFKVRAAVTGVGVRLELLGHRASRMHRTGASGLMRATQPPRRRNEQRLLKLPPGRGTYNGR